ncbi:T9SS type A sorting domain-containing protein [Mesohalobacter halotolerans]|uniref:T9SS type A sorting domain-containing protein n=1 Tax=Mesohalobacter halotolerans TaxID=1883405 RepID=A0A4U5TQ45_9FLAO|nr:T9SS type A sorting domain-containing protein [Mesohalobacter halotolerans]TKS55851.1 T9SS type A sorting domain-containing protein [Mesohalobacter halotolerans]
MKINFIYVFLLCSSFVIGQTLTISDEGETGTSGTNWSITNNTLSTTGTASIQASVIESALVDGDFIVEASTINLDEAIVSTSSNQILIKANESINLSANINTSGGNGHIILEGQSSIRALGANRMLNSGSGNITLTTNNLSSTDQYMIIESTGAFTLQPYGTAFSDYGNQMDIDGTITNDTFSGSADASGLRINNISQLTGLNFGKEGNTTGFTISNDWIINGPISFIGDNMNVQAGGGLTSTADNGDILIKVNNNIDIEADRSLVTNNGNIIFWTNPAASNISGHIKLSSGVTLNTANGSTTSDLSGGGDIILAGGQDTDNDGLPDGFAKTTSTYGIQLDTGVKLHSGGGDVILRGETYDTSNNRHGIFQTGDLTVNSGTGSILMEAKNRESYGSWPLQLGSGTVSNLSLVSAKPSDNAITIKSTGGRYGIDLGSTSGSTMQLLATGGGDILVTTKYQIQISDDYTFQTNNGNIVFWTNPAASNISGHIKLSSGVTLNTANGSTTSDLSGGGDIILAGGQDTDNDGLPDGFAKTTSTYGIQLDTGVKLHSGGGDVILRGETYDTSNNRHGIFQTGDLTVNSGTGSILMEAKNRESYGSWPLQLGSGTVSNLSLVSAKPSDNAITIKSTGGRYGIDLGSTSGSTMQLLATGGGDILLTADHEIQTTDDYQFETKGNGQITFKSVDEISLGQNNQLQTDNADIVLWTNPTASNNATGYIKLSSDVTLNTANGSIASDLSGGGNIILAGGADTNNDDFPDGFAKTTSTYGIQLDTGVKLHSGGGDVILRGETYDTNTNRHGIFQTGDLTVNSGTGSILMEAKNRESYGNWPLQLGSGTVSNLSLVSAKSTGNAITLKSSDGRASLGTYLRGTAGATMQLLATGGGDIVVTAKRDVKTTDDYTFQTNGGDIVMWPNNTGANRGRLYIGDNNIFNSIGGQTDQTTGGGDIIFAGGTDDGNNRPSGYARNDNKDQGIYIRSGLEVYSGGGDITFKGSTNEYNRSSIRGIEFIGDLTIYSGEGIIEFDGKVLRTNGASGYGIEFADGTSNSVSVTSDKADGDAITINGNNTPHNVGIYFGATTSGLFEATSGGNIMVTTAKGIQTTDDYTFQTNGGDIVMWPNNTGANRGRLYIDDNNIFNSIGGQTDQATGGGNIIFAGGTDDGNNRPSGYARNDTRDQGIYVRSGLEVYSGGGDITFKGSTNEYNRSSIRGIEFIGDLTIYSGEGIIEFDGKILRTNGASGYGIEFADGTSNSVSVISDKADGDAITINGNNTPHNVGIYFGATTSGLFEATSGGNIVVTTARGIQTRDGYTFQTNDADLVFWADRDANGDGRIYTQNSILFNSAGGSIDQAAGGGNIILAGGLDDGANGGTANDGIPDGFAYDRTWRGVNLGDGAQMYSGGGDVTIRGRTYSTSNTYGIQQNNDLLINSGQGKITLHGKTRTTHDGDAVLLANNGTTDGFSLVSDKASGTAIEIIGEAHSYGVISNSTGSKIIEATGGGDVLIDGQTPSAGYGVYLRDFDILAVDGKITVDGYSTGIYLYDLNFGQLDNTLITASDVNVMLRSDRFNTNGTSAIVTTGEVNIEPHSNSFDNQFTYPISNVSLSSSVTALTIGKLSNVEDIEVVEPTTINGPISIFGKDININDNLANTSGKLTITSSGTVGQSAAITTNHFVMNGSGDFNLQNNANDFGTISGGDESNPLGDIIIRNATSTGIGYNTTDGLYSNGIILIETENGDLVVSENITTTSASTDAIILNAGRSASVGSMGGGDIIVSGSPVISFGSGGQAKFFSGTELDSTGLSTLVGGSNNTIFGFDETSDLSNEGLVTNQSYAIYRLALRDLTIVPSGGDTENSTWRFDISSRAISTISDSSDPVNVNASVLENHLINGELSINAKTIIVNSDITNSTGNSLLFRAKESIELESDHKLETTNGDVVFEAGNYLTSISKITFNNNVEIDAGSADVLLRSDHLVVDTNGSASSINTSGTLTIEPSSNSFGEAFSFPIPNLNVANTIEGLNIGKPSNTSQVTFNNDVSINGPITTYGGTINLEANLTTTNNGDISLYTDNALGGLSTSRTLTAAGAFKYIPGGTAFTADVSYPITNLTATSTGLTIGKSGNDKDITINTEISGDAGVELYGNELNINDNIDVTNTGNLTLEGVATIKAGKYIASDGNFTHDGDLVFKSDASNGDSYLGEIGGTYTKTSGTVISEKYYPAKRAFRMVASPVDGESIFANWQNGGVNDTGIGTHITGEQGTVGNYNATTGIDYTQSGAHSLFSFSATNGWEAITNTKNTDLEVGKPYRLMVRGDRTVDLTDNDATPTTTTLISTGDLEVGNTNITFPSATAGSTTYAFIANPYQSKIDVSEVLAANTNTDNTKLWVWDPMVNNRGAFVLIDELSGNGTTTPSSTATKFIEPGQAFFIELNGSDSELTFTESEKAVSSLSQSPESLSQQPQLLFNLHDEDQEVIDAIRLRFSPDGNNDIDQLDISKLGNMDENLASVNGNSLFTIQKRSLPETDEEISLFTNNWRNENYSFSANLNNLEATDVYLVDHYLGTETLISNGTAYSFSVDANISESVNNLRFALKFDNETMGIDEQENSFFSLYPNPAKDIVNIQTSLPLGSQATVEVYNMLGQLVISQTQAISYTSLHIGVNALEAGVYLVKLTDQDGYSQTQELIKE